jgi:hypothetical protein
MKEPVEMVPWSTAVAFHIVAGLGGLIAGFLIAASAYPAACK